MEEKDEALYIKVIVYDTAGDRSAVKVALMSEVIIFKMKVEGQGLSKTLRPEVRK